MPPMAQGKRVIVMLDPERMFTRGVLRGIGRYVRGSRSPWTFFRPSNFRRGLAKTSILVLVRRLRADGVIVRQDEDIELLVQKGIPVVTMNYTGRHLPGIASLSSDMLAIGRMAAAHLLERGFRHFGFCGYTDRQWSLKRQHSFTDAITQAGYTVDAYASHECSSLEEWIADIEAVASWLKQQSRPIGVMACNDDRGEQVIEACRLAGLRVPDEVAVVAVDNDPAVCVFANPRLSSISLNVEDAGCQAAETLDLWMAGRRRSFIDILVRPVRVVTRESTDVVATDDLEVSRAARFIRENSARAIQVRDVVEHVGVSRRKLETGFRRALNASILDRIRSARVERAATMLAETSLPVFEIAGQLEFAGSPQFSRYFKQVTGMSPRRYRALYSGR
jgi:LacI family transcriptional regulator